MKTGMRLLIVCFIGVVGVSCTGETCEEFDCATLAKDSSKAGKHVTVCKRPKECEGCFYWKLLDENDEKIDECQDSQYQGVVASCEPFIDRHAQDWCSMGQFCKQNGNSCGRSNTADSTCCSG